MKIKTSSILRFWFLSLLCIATGVHHIVGLGSVLNISYVGTLSSLSSFGLGIICFVRLGDLGDSRKRINRVVLMVITMFIALGLYSLTYYKGRISLYYMIRGYEKYFFILLVYPMLYFIKTDKGADKILKQIFVIIFIATLARTISWFGYNFAGVRIFGGFIDEIPAGYTREGLLRFPACSLHGLGMILADHYTFTSKKRIRRIRYFLLAVGYVLYGLFVQQSRSYAIVGAACLVIFWLYSRKSAVGQLFKWTSTIVVTFVIAISGIVMEILLSFSEAGIYGAGTSARFMAIAYYFEKLMQQPVFGLGLVYVDTTEALYDILRGNRGIFYIEDLGLMGQFFNFGFFGGFIILVIIIYMFRKGIANWVVNSKYKLTSIGSMVYIVISSAIPLSIFYNSLFIMVPMFLILFECADIEKEVRWKFVTPY